MLHNFWEWVVRREQYRSNLRMPKLPDITYKLAWRNIIDMELQAAILDEIKRLTALGQVLTPEQIQRAVTGHVSSAFKRYMLPDKNGAIQGAMAVQEIQPGGGQHFRAGQER